MPISRTKGTSSVGEIPLFSMPTERIIQSMATREPTEMSMPPVSITQVMPQAMQIRAALVRKISRKF